jgi:hypothetical protein
VASASLRLFKRSSFAPSALEALTAPRSAFPAAWLNR